VPLAAAKTLAALFLNFVLMPRTAGDQQMEL
jgi:hypothetical protein